jgi:kynurenine formamidase
MNDSVSASDIDQVLAAVTNASVIDLSHEWFVGMPVSPVHPPYFFSLIRRHGDMVRDDLTSTANECVMFCLHTGTHIDAIGHASCDDVVYGGLSASDIQKGTHGLSSLGAETIAPIVCRGLLLDIAALHDVSVLEPGYEVTAHDLELACYRAGATPAAGDAVLIRTGWAQHWPDSERFVGANTGTPGISREGAQWLADFHVHLVGGDTLTLEQTVPQRNVRPVHGLLLADRGIHIVEAMNLEPLAAANLSRFVFVAAPLRIVGGTGSPIRPLAIGVNQ